MTTNFNPRHLPGTDQDGHVRSVWNIRAERLLQEAIGAIEESDDVFGYIGAAEACLRIEYGELSEDELAGYPFPGEEPDESACICSPNQRATGGFTSRCPTHGIA